METNLVSILEQARNLYASNPSHVPFPQTPGLGTHCVITAVRTAIEPESGPGFGTMRRIDAAQDALKYAAGVRSLVHFNATHTTEEVLAVFDAAIAAL